MNTIFKKAQGINYIPLLFLTLFAFVFIGNVVYAKYATKTTEEWVPDETVTSPDPLNPNHYVIYNGNLATDCDQLSAICGIIATEDPMNPGKPLISEELEDRIDREDTSHGDVFLKPFNPTN